MMDARELKARLIVATGNISEVHGIYYVPSQSGNGRYRVQLDGLFPNCSCDDFELRGEPCKHMLAATEWAALKRAGAPLPRMPRGEADPPPRKTYKQDWPNYNLAQNYEKDHF